MSEDDDVVEIRREVDMNELSWPSRDQDLTDDSGVGLNRRYIDLRRMPWSEAKRVLAIEVARLHHGNMSAATDESSERQFDEDRSQQIADSVVSAHSCDDDGYEEDELYEDLFGLDIGVASAVLALSAAGCIPFTSCNGGDGHLELYPLVVCWARPQRVLDLLDVAEEAGCGLVNCDEGSVQVYADDVLKMVDFARILISRRNVLRKVGRPRISNTRYAEASLQSSAIQLTLPFRTS